jgi:polysaccharide export outer membrane protein
VSLISKRLSQLVIIALLASVPPCSGLQGSYRIGSQDVIKIEVAGDPQFSGEALISDGGTIAYSVLGEIKVVDLTVTEIAELIRKQLMDRKLLIQPSVTVSVKEYRGHSVTVLGEVKVPGKYYLKGAEILLDVIASAGGISPNAGDVTINRSGPGGPQIITVSGERLLSDSTPLISGDVIFVKVREIYRVYVSGEVVSGKPMLFENGLTVSQAVLMAGGLNRFGSKSKITIRRIVKGKEQIIKVNLADIEKGKAKDIALMPNDQIIVGRRIF